MVRSHEFCQCFKSIEDLKLVAHEATRGLQMAPNFNGTLSCCKLKMISGVLLESSAEIAKAADPFEGLINLCGKIAIGRSLSKFSCSQLAGLMGLVITTFSPKLAVPILLKKIAEDMECLKSGMEVVR